ncbi:MULTISPECIES: hypothetical protein [Protofrankia]|uniref:Uncharacterized protein n=1 Tax=Candidatus Protofrankia datiscae TaxID=2716812 RepID=F8B0N0_9ACTN|nr:MULTISPECIES: hypothetical protein [Protofrankia]AEH10662.1 hypothetical protein FsymDg_3361 [Candidatus Protofrankia datiscae]
MRRLPRHLGALLTLLVVGSAVLIAGAAGTASARTGDGNTFHWTGRNIELRRLALDGTVSPADGTPAALLRIGELVNAADFRLEREIHLGTLGTWTLTVTANTMTTSDVAAGTGTAAGTAAAESSGITAPFTCVHDAGVHGSGGATGQVLDPALNHALDVDPATGYRDTAVSAVVGLVGRGDVLLTLGRIYSESSRITMPRLRLTGASVLLRPGGYSPGLATPPAYCGGSASQDGGAQDDVAGTGTAGVTPAAGVPATTPATATASGADGAGVPGPAAPPPRTAPAPTTPASGQPTPSRRCHPLDLLCVLSGPS